MYGIDIVIPDFSYLIANRSKIVGMVITHGHEDHIGAIPYLLKHIKIPVYGTRLTLGLVENKLKEHEVIGDLRTINAGDKFKLGEYFDIETIRTTHSIADAICLAITTPAGVVFHSGDFKIDYTPIDGEPIDFSKLAQIGKKGVTLMLCDLLVERTSRAEDYRERGQGRPQGGGFRQKYGKRSRARDRAGLSEYPGRHFGRS